MKSVFLCLVFLFVINPKKSYSQSETITPDNRKRAWLIEQNIIQGIFGDVNNIFVNFCNVV